MGKLAVSEKGTGNWCALLLKHPLDYTIYPTTLLKAMTTSLLIQQLLLSFGMIL